MPRHTLVAMAALLSLGLVDAIDSIPAVTPDGLMAALGRTPRPTDPPGLPPNFPRELLGRQATSTSTTASVPFPPPAFYCGLVDGDPANALTCVDAKATCIHTGTVGGCCQSRNIQDCTTIASSCVPSGAACNSNCRSDPRVLKCSVSTIPYCGTYLFNQNTSLLGCFSYASISESVMPLSSYYSSVYGPDYTTLLTSTTREPEPTSTFETSTTSSDIVFNPPNRSSSSEPSGPTPGGDEPEGQASGGRKSKGISGGAIGGIVAGVVAGVGALIFALWFFVFKKKGDKAADNGATGGAPPAVAHQQQQQHQPQQQQAQQVGPVGTPAHGNQYYSQHAPPQATTSSYAPPQAAATSYYEPKPLVEGDPAPPPTYGYDQKIQQQPPQQQPYSQPPYAQPSSPYQQQAQLYNNNQGAMEMPGSNVGPQQPHPVSLSPGPGQAAGYYNNNRASVATTVPSPSELASNPASNGMSATHSGPVPEQIYELGGTGNETR
ncbi:hypothetical protein FQN57_003611 [Myotisia sp. PD_48]|nr:hypothetical protein FQN57_003611 [Myotisia sp. PD_48]